jgi:hypothetical protein
MPEASERAFDGHDPLVELLLVQPGHACEAEEPCSAEMSRQI